MSKNDAKSLLGSLEYAVMCAIRELQGDAYGYSIQRFLAKQGRKDQLGSIYTVLSRLQKKRFASSTWGEATKKRGGRRKRLYDITPAGYRALQNTEAHYSGGFDNVLVTA